MKMLKRMMKLIKKVDKLDGRLAPLEVSRSITNSPIWQVAPQQLANLESCSSPTRKFGKLLLTNLPIWQVGAPGASPTRQFGELLLTNSPIWRVAHHQLANLASCSSPTRQFGELLLTNSPIWELLLTNSPIWRVAPHQLANLASCSSRTRQFGAPGASPTRQFGEFDQSNSPKWRVSSNHVPSIGLRQDQSLVLSRSELPLESYNKNRQGPYA
ncbi:hypothetical protein Bca101_067919 [Brassica carinata]